ncbi:glycine betaine/proline transport system permease protein [Mesorhizobium soli]|uniref:ABC transporter permease n=1 Tax=Pseudaminobacter soli (ex Li et al. 2025) TaxID=1295366 RepID=UPI0024731094|nr:ABC transporter permease subunit [Mesorhizobium soli]MDH6233176.1 glycine betaine/proline transport system permease protein [Mesorhizobium soli]
MKSHIAILFSPAAVRALAVPGALLLCVVAGARWNWIAQFPDDWTLPVAAGINLILNWIIPNVLPLTSTVSQALGTVLAALVATLQFLPWPAVALTVMLIGFKAGGLRLLVLCLCAVSYIVLAGFWRQSMATLSLVILAVPISVLGGFLLGLSAFLLPRVRRPVEVLFDFMQTFPAFAYLIPLLLLFGFGPIAGLVATAIYAIPPMARCILSGLTQVPRELVEVGEMTGCTPLQRLLWVELPSAKPMMMVGINQTTMAALSMVITASIIGGFDDIGWAVLSGLRQADLGKSLLSGLVIVLISIITDRITSGIFAGQRARNDWRVHLGRASVLIAAAAIVGLGALSRWVVPDLVQGLNETRGVIDLSVVNSAVLGFVARYSDKLDAIKSGILYYLVLPLRLGLSGAVLPTTWGFAMTPPVSAFYAAVALLLAIRQWAKGKPGAAAGTLSLAILLYIGLVGFPWPAAILLVMWCAWRVSGPKFAFFTSASLAFVLLSGLWIPFVKSLYLVGVSVTLCALVGGLLGMLAAHNNWLSAGLRPINDALQTMPQFVFLIPALMFFKVGEFAGLIAISLYAIVPAIRYTEAGLRAVPATILETARQLGCTPVQSNLLVQVPLARPALLLGLNQTVMAAITMLPIAATVGTAELGQQIYISLGKADAGLGITAGIVFCLTAINLDRMLRAAAERLRNA